VPASRIRPRPFALLDLHLLHHSIGKIPPGQVSEIDLTINTRTGIKHPPHKEANDPKKPLDTTERLGSMAAAVLARLLINYVQFLANRFCARAVEPLSAARCVGRSFSVKHIK
jgi:hypothetical protein